MLKITINDQDIRNSKTVEALVQLVHLLSQTASQSEHTVHKSRPIQPPQKKLKRDYVFICPQTYEIEPWVSLLKQEHQHFVNRLKRQGQLSLSEAADILGILPSSKNIKKHVNGSIGSILRWSKLAFLQQVYTGNFSDLKPESIKLIPPWYCDQGIYYWRIVDRK